MAKPVLGLASQPIAEDVYMPGPKPTPGGWFTQNLKTIALVAVIVALTGIVIYLLAR